jgi:hypothetical protein
MVSVLAEADLDPIWQQMEHVRKDGTLLLLIVDYRVGDHQLEDARYARTIGFNNADNDGEDVWHFAGWCWTHDHFVEGKGRPVRWALLSPDRTGAAPEGGAAEHLLTVS